MGEGRLARILSLRHSPAEVGSKTAEIYQRVLERSVLIRSGNFDFVGEADLRLLFDLYDAEFFNGLLSGMLREDVGGRITLRLSDRMTRAAGKTILRRIKARVGRRIVERPEYEIAVSTFLLFQTFDDIERPVTVTGLVCRDRLEALQRIFEHELVHLAEFLAEGKSSCAANQFQALSRAIFGHESVVHDLVTPARGRRQGPRDPDGRPRGLRPRRRHPGRPGQPDHEAGDGPGRGPRPAACSQTTGGTRRSTSR